VVFVIGSASGIRSTWCISEGARWVICTTYPNPGRVKRKGHCRSRALYWWKVL